MKEHGARGDGVTDDTVAIQRTIDNAEENDIIVLPAGTYRVNARGREDDAALSIRADRHPSRLVLTGVGERTTIRLEEGHVGTHIGLRVSVGDGFDDLQLQNFTIDGNRPGQRGELARQVGNCLVVRDATRQSVGTNAILIENVRTRNAIMNGFRIRTGGVTMNQVAARANGRHGFALTTGLKTQADDPPTVVRNAFATGNGVENGNGHGFDLSGGKLVLENAISEANHQGTKSTEEVLAATYRNVVLRANVNHGYIRPGSATEISQRSTVVMENVIAESNGSSGYRFGRDTDYEIGDILARENGQTYDKSNIRVRDNAHLEAETIYSLQGASKSGLSYYASTSSSIGTYWHQGNPEGGLAVDKGTLKVEEKHHGIPEEMPDVSPTDRSSLGIEW